MHTNSLMASVALVAAVMVGTAFVSNNAGAATVSVVSQDTVTLLDPTINNATAVSTTGNVLQLTTGSIPNEQRSPFEDYSTQVIPSAYANATYTSVSSPSNSSSSAKYSLSGNFLMLLWGSPDTYNTITFYDISGNAIASITGGGSGSSIAPQTYGHDLVVLSLDETFYSVSFSSTQAAFEFADLMAFNTQPNPSAFITPLPAALPLFATGLGALGVLGWRRKRKIAAALAAA